MFRIIKFILCAILIKLNLLEIVNGHQYTDNIQEEALLTVPEFIVKYGYPVEIHNVTTSDGYILEMHRIPNGKYVKGKTVYIQHGLVVSSADFVITGPGKALGLILADEGYDVWLGNIRGNRYSRKHVVLDPDLDDEFWDFSWHENGVIDVPAMIDYILETTGETQLFHIGHSQGTTSFYVMASMKPEYNDKIKLHVSLAPVAYLDHAKSPVLTLLSTYWGQPAQTFLSMGDVNGIFSNGEFTIIGDAYCGDPYVSSHNNLVFLLAGYNSRQINETLLPIINGHLPAGASLKQLGHYLQVLKSKRFRQYDYDFLGNLRKYGRLSPPDYEIKNISAPVYLIYSRNDLLAAKKDVLRLSRELPNLGGKFEVPDRCFGHLDFTYGRDAPKLVYETIINILAGH